MYGIYTEKATANRFASLYATTKFYSYMYLENNDKEKKTEKLKRNARKKRKEPKIARVHMSMQHEYRRSCRHLICTEPNRS